MGEKRVKTRGLIGKEKESTYSELPKSCWKDIFPIIAQVM